MTARCIAALLAFAISAAAATAQVNPPTPPPPAAETQPAAAQAVADTGSVRAVLDAARAEIDQAEAAVRRPSLGSDELQALRGRLDPITERLREAIGEIEPKLEAARARLEQLGPKPKAEAPPEGPEVARDRAGRDAAVGEFDETQRLARALLLQAEQLTSQISDRRRASFTTALFQRSYSVVSPDLWLGAAQAFSRDLRALTIVGGDALSRIHDRSSPWVLTLLALSLGVGTALHIARRNLAPRLVRRDPSAVEVSPRKKLLAALGVLLVETLPAAAGSVLIYQTLVLLDLLSFRLLPVAATVLGGLVFLAFAQGLVNALFAPGRPAWRIVSVSEAAASWTMSFVVAFGAIVAVGKVLDALNGAIAAGLPIAIAVRAVVAVAAALTLAELLRRLAATETQDETCLGPYIPTEPEVGGPVRFVGWLLVGLVLAAAVAGYVAFAAFLVDQIVWISALAGLLYLALAACDRFVGGTLKEDSRVSTTLQHNLGLRRRALEQLGVVTSGLAKVVLIIVAGMIALAPWGIESGDIASNLRAAFFGFKVGDVTISLSTTIGAVLCFVFAVAATRVVQRWLTHTFLPTTELDSGLRNSIATAAGYLGFFAAASAAFAYLGLSLEKIAIVAGALSVGIGFGLQSIVNNFVSGLILLWERPIRVGDLVVVGDAEGYVRRISVRATEIQTLDRAAVIVPNSNLISGVVKNRVRGDLTGRVVVSVSIGRDKDPARAAEILTASAGAHPDILKEPAPRVMFKRIGDSSLEFDLVGFVADVNTQARVASDLNFSVFRALVDAGIVPMPGPATPLGIVGLDDVGGALQHIADAIAAQAGSGAPDRDVPSRPRAVEARGRAG